MAKTVDDGVKQLFDYMKGTKWKKAYCTYGIEAKAVTYSRARGLGKQTKYGRTIIVVGIKR